MKWCKAYETVYILDSEGKEAQPYGPWVKSESPWKLSFSQSLPTVNSCMDSEEQGPPSMTKAVEELLPAIQDQVVRLGHSPDPERQSLSSKVPTLMGFDR
ncbi:hypothetical protein O6P43_031856 [Quillaja saponaria]|uniref:Uncharacterized protein n=1 Tax=Quillaja saponaria TaxID=32244 RepID=A0AAD7KWB3_QUISA|nr:hypothetical protein O6P43_031856 [Quillaja saponaria]